jgi:hypothetical protein
MTIERSILQVQIHFGSRISTQSVIWSLCKLSPFPYYALSVVIFWLIFQRYSLKSEPAVAHKFKSDKYQIFCITYLVFILFQYLKVVIVLTYKCM